MERDYRFDCRRLPELAVPTAVCLIVLCALPASTGCWRSAILPSRDEPRPLYRSEGTADFSASGRDQLAAAEHAYAEGMAFLAESDSNATTAFLDATSRSWQVVRKTAGVGGPTHERAGAVYHESLKRLIESAHQFDQLDPHLGLQVATAQGPVNIPVRYHGFAWKAGDFNRWIPVTDYEDEHLVRRHRRIGWGVPLVIVRQRESDERFMAKSLPFSATALLRPSSSANADSGQRHASLVLEVFNPLVVKTLSKDDGQTTPLAADTSAPIAWLNQNTPHLNFEAFLHPDRMHRSGQLIMLEPYQTGKIPVIFVHGLLSDPLTWNGLVNELRASEWFNDRYQVWVFGYSTGRPFLRSAADMRRELQEAFTQLAKDNPDPALHRAVLVGHSMGGLLSKLLVSHSESMLWNAFASRPLESLQTDQVTHHYLSELFFFEAVPHIERAVFIGTPHGGSPIATEWVGRLGSHLVSRAHDFSDEYESFLHLNRGAIEPFFAKHIPTSIDMLEPQDPVLQAMRRLQVAPRVRLHSVIGNGHTMLVGGPADGVVPIESARHRSVESEILVPATHRHLQAHPDTVDEVLRILRLHSDESTRFEQSQVSDSRWEAPASAAAGADPV